MESNEIREGFIYPSLDDLLLVEDLPPWIDRHFLRHDPYAFNVGGENLFPEFVHTCAKDLNVDPNGIYCIGSGAIGLSFNPRKVQDGGLKRFNRESDLDVAVISPYLFETAWRDLRVATHFAYSNPSGSLLRKIEHQRSRMFDGAIIANKLMSSLSFSDTWSAARLRLRFDWRDRLNIIGDLNFWIYRDYWSVRSYAVEGVHKSLEKVRLSR